MSATGNSEKKNPSNGLMGRLLIKLGSKRFDPERIFTNIYRKNKFGGVESISGPGSDLVQTKVLIRELPRIFKEMNIATVLDIPCGDFYWMRTMDLSGIKYIGGDIVKEMVQKNRMHDERDGVVFQHMDLIKDDLPKVDLVLCRDCLVHFSFNDIFLALKNICRSQSTYFLATTFTERKSNPDIPTGKWRALNLVAPPFNLPEPMKVINEECPHENGSYADKSLGLWSIAALAQSLDKTIK